MLSLRVVATIAATVSFLLCYPVLNLLRRMAVLDMPNARSSHNVAIPRGGGVAPAVALVIAAFITHREHLALVILIYGALGLAEDIVGVSARTRLIVQFAGAIVLTPIIVGVVPMPFYFGALAVLGIVVWMAGFVNAFNFMDGINGVSVGQAVASGLVWTISGEIWHKPSLTWGGCVLAAVAIGFLPFNFPKARMFLGDCGSYAIGSWMAAMVVIGIKQGLPLDVILMPVLIAVGDTSLTLARRLMRGEHLAEAHRQHVYQRLVQRGWSHAKTTTLVTCVAFMVGCVGVCGARLDVSMRLIADCISVMAVVVYLAGPELLAHIESRDDDVEKVLVH